MNPFCLPFFVWEKKLGERIFRLY